MFLAIEESGSFHTFRPLEVSDKWGTWYGQTITPAEFLRSASYYTVTAKFAADRLASRHRKVQRYHRLNAGKPGTLMTPFMSREVMKHG